MKHCTNISHCINFIKLYSPDFRFFVEPIYSSCSQCQRPDWLPSDPASLANLGFSDSDCWISHFLAWGSYGTWCRVNEFHRLSCHPLPREVSHRQPRKYHRSFRNLPHWKAHLKWKVRKLFKSRQFHWRESYFQRRSAGPCRCLGIPSLALFLRRLCTTLLIG